MASSPPAANSRRAVSTKNKTCQCDLDMVATYVGGMREGLLQHFTLTVQSQGVMSWTRTSLDLQMEVHN